MKDLIALTINNMSINAPGSVPQPSTDMSERIIGNGITIFTTLGIAVSIIMIAWAGIQWSMSKGDKQKVAAARAKLTWSIVGVVIMLIALVIVNLFSYFLGVELLNLQLK